MALLNLVKNVPSFDIDTATIAVHGEPGVGKTTFTDQIPDVLHISTEGRCNGVTGWKEELKDWEWLEKIVEELPKHPCKTVSIDVFANLWGCAAQKYCKDHGIKDLVVESGYKPGYSVVATMVHNMLLRLVKMKRLVMVCHSAWYDKPTAMNSLQIPGQQEVLKRKWFPECAGSGGTGKPHQRMHSILGKLVGVELFMEMEDGKRIIHPNASDKWEAKVKLAVGNLPDNIVIANGSIGYNVLKEAIEAAKK